MKTTILFLLAACISCQVSKQTTTPVDTVSSNLFDSTRNRQVPITSYYKNKVTKQTPVIISHGYQVPNTGYSAIAQALAQQGYYVISIQHELPTDAPIPSTGPIYETRKPFWQRGADNILFVIQKMKQIQPSLQYDSLVLIGHSNGGDMSMLFAQEHPHLAAKVISLDNRRMPFPRTAHPRIYSLRSSDQPADEGVLPTPQEQQQYHVRIVQLKNTIHNDMGDHGTREQQKEIIGHILEFLNP